MAYTVVENFNLGIDRRRPIYASFNGAVWDAINCHLTRGGDLEKRKAFVKKFTLPTGKTFGLFSVSGSLYTFGSDAAVGVPQGIIYQQLSHPDGLAMTRILSVTAYDGKPYVAASFADGSVYNYYGGTIVRSFVDGVVRASFATPSGIAQHLADLIAQDNAYIVSRAGSVITVRAASAGVAFTYSTFVSNRGALNDQEILTELVTVNAEGVQQEVRFTVSGTPEVGDRYCITIDSKEFGARSNPVFTPTQVYTFRSKVYGLASSLLQFSGTSNATGWNSVQNAGAGFLNLSTADAGSANLTGIEVFQGGLAVLSERVVQIYFVREDASLNNLLQTLKNTGTSSPRSVLAYGDIDVFYLSDSGVRSIRARAPSNAAFVNDIGTTIDGYIREDRKGLTDEQIQKAVAVIEPLDGRYMLAVGKKIYVLSYFPSSQISGWTSYSIPFEVDDFAVNGDRLYARSGDDVYLYGGDDNALYDESVMFVQLPFLTGGKAGTGKNINGIDISSTGDWYCEMLVNPRNLADKLIFGDVSGVSWDEMNVSAFAYPTHIAPNFTSKGSGYCSLSSIGINFTGGNEK